MEFRLLVESSNQSHHGTFMMDGRHWSVTEPYDMENQGAIPEYTCISYVWGEHRVPNPLEPALEISSHTLPALAAAISNNLGTAFWIDAFCIPSDGPKKRATLESMGFIYSAAKQVVVAFSDASFTAIKHLIQSDRLDEDQLRVLESDEWVKSVWTYQEVVNSKQLYCVCQEFPGWSIEGAQFLNRLGGFLQSYAKSNHATGIGLTEQFPRLSALEDLIADWLLSGYMERSALQVMSNMDRRVHSEPTNQFYSMIGAITQKYSRTSTNRTVSDLAELFMTICEEKNDYSFIYSAADRDPQPAKRWRPVAGFLPSILPWHSWGEAQRARQSRAGLWLEGIVTLQPSPTLSSSSKEIITKWSGHTEPIGSDKDIADHLYDALKRVGYKGSSEYLVVGGGLFFPWHTVQAPVMVLVASSIRWVLGAPGLLVHATEEGRKYIPGVFAGLVAEQDAGTVLLRTHSK